MAENKEGIGILEKMALLSDAVENTFPNSKTAVVVEMNKKDFIMAKKDLLIPNEELKEFKVDISGTEFIFLFDESLNVSEDKI